jgi:hypothetical protein
MDNCLSNDHEVEVTNLTNQKLASDLAASDLPGGNKNIVIPKENQVRKYCVDCRKGETYDVSRR